MRDHKNGRWAAVPLHRPMADGETLGGVMTRYTTRREAQAHCDEIRKSWPAAMVVDLDACDVTFTWRAPGAREAERARLEAHMAAWNAEHPAPVAP